jgi:hypothetical protein
MTRSSAYRRRTVRISRYGAGRLGVRLSVLEGKDGDLEDLVVYSLPDGSSRLVATSSTGCLRMWGTRRGAALEATHRVERAHDDEAVYRLAVVSSAKGDGEREGPPRLATASETGTVGT